MRKKTSAIYMIQNTENHKMYIGGTTNVKARKRQHFFELRNNIHKNWKLQNDFNAYGEEYFEFTILENLYKTNGSDLTKREQAWLDALSPEYNLNQVAGSFVSEVVYSPEAKEKRRATMTGRKQSPETIAKRVAKNIEHWKTHKKIITPEQREKLRLANLGEKNPNWGTKRSENFKSMIGELFSSVEYIYKKPDGELAIFTNLSSFCKDNDLNYTAMRALHYGKRKSPYNGWTFVSKRFIGYSK